MDEREDRVFRCRHCKRISLKRNAGQNYCGREACQKARKNAWRRGKYEGDPDYRANQRDSTRAWLESQGGAAAYYRRYRKRTEKRTHLQRPPRAEAGDGGLREREDETTRSANSDAKKPLNPLKSGKYKLSLCDGANSDAFLVELALISSG